MRRSWFNFGLHIYTVESPRTANQCYLVLPSSRFVSLAAPNIDHAAASTKIVGILSSLSKAASQNCMRVSSVHELTFLDYLHSTSPTFAQRFRTLETSSATLTSSSSCMFLSISCTQHGAPSMSSARSQIPKLARNTSLNSKRKVKHLQGGL